VFMFACNDTIAKHLATSYNVPMMAGMRYLVNTILVLAIFAPREKAKLFATKRTGLVLLRAASLTGGTLFMSLALQLMPVAETVALIYLTPLIVTLLAGPFLGERVGISAWIATAMGFLGVVLIARPGSGLNSWGVVLALIGVSVSVIYHMLSRALATTETTMAMLFFTALFGTVFFGAALPWHWINPLNGLDAALFLSMGILATLGHYCFTAAYREAPASLLGPVNYMHLAWAGILGWLVYDHVPDAISLVGMALIALAGIAVALKTHLARASPEALAQEG
jgi:drug/metabolite transporter (DMT)-like permease